MKSKIKTFLNIFQKKKNKLKINKKAVFQAASDTAFALLFLFLGILFMTFTTEVNKNAKAELGAVAMNKAIFENNVALYLKQPVVIDGQNLTMADLIVLAVENKGRYKTDLEQKTKQFFSNTNLDMKKMLMTVESKKGTFYIGTGEKGSPQSPEYPSALFYLPGYYDQIKVFVVIQIE